MNKAEPMQITYDPSVGALTVELAPAAASQRTVRVGPHCRVDLDRDGRPVAVEILDAPALYPIAALERLGATGAEFSLAEIGAEYGLDPSTLRHQIRNGRLEARKVGRDWKIKRSAMETYLEQRAPSGRRAQPPSRRRKSRAR